MSGRRLTSRDRALIVRALRLAGQKFQEESFSLPDALPPGTCYDTKFKIENLAEQLRHDSRACNDLAERLGEPYDAQS